MKLRVSCETWRRFAFGVMAGTFAVFLIGVAGVVESDFLGTTKIADFLGAEDIREAAMAYLDAVILCAVGFLCADYHSVLRDVQEIVNHQNARLDGYERFTVEMSKWTGKELQKLYGKIDGCESDGKQKV